MEGSEAMKKLANSKKISAKVDECRRCIINLFSWESESIKLINLYNDNLKRDEGNRPKPKS